MTSKYFTFKTTVEKIIFKGEKKILKNFHRRLDIKFKDDQNIFKIHTNKLFYSILHEIKKNIKQQ